jgi:CubicO group peptidase (beta-lactamase class C family)
MTPTQSGAVAPASLHVGHRDRITLRMLADMTSGLKSYTRSTSFTDVVFSEPETAWTPEQLLQIGLDESPIFAPGAQFDYSNTNTVLLGMVIEKVTGKPVEDVFQEMVFDPLGLDGTSWPRGTTDLPDPHPQGYTLQGNAATPDNPSNATNWNPSWGWTAGELISTMDDLLVYGRSLGNGRELLGEEAHDVAEMAFEDAHGFLLGVASTPRSSRRLLDPQDHGSLEDITLHPQLGVLPLQVLEPGPLIDREAFLLAALDAVTVHPVAQRPRVDPKVPGHLSDRLPRLAHDPDSALTELRVVLPSCLWHHHSS